ncbi:MAG: hypothetical protein AAGI34_18795 [Pseudomonadota bacterium]
MSFRLVRGALCAAAALLLAVPAAADLADGLAGCAAISANQDRLACFDRLAEQATTDVFSGKGGGMTGAFTVETPRLLHFESSDVIMIATLLRADGSVAQNLHQAGRGVGRHLIAIPGEYRLQVDASGAWRVWLSTPGQDGVRTD